MFKNEKFKKFFFSFIWLGVLLLLIDIITKLVIGANRETIMSMMAQNNGHGIILIPNFLAISYVENGKAAFGLGFSDYLINRIVYIIVASVASGLLIFYFIKSYKKLNKIIKAAIMMIVAGAIGNMIDRICYGFSGFKVVDWIDFYGIWQWNFNIADSCIVIAAFMVIIYLIVEEIIEYKKKPKEVRPNKVYSKEEQERIDKDKNE